MRQFRKMIPLMLVVLAAPCGISVCSLPTRTGGSQAGRHDMPPDDPVRRSEDELRAVASLTELRVPLERDTQGRVRWIEAAKGELSDEAMRYLPDLFMLEWLEIGGGPVTAAGMAHLGNCPSIRRLYVHDINLNDDSLAWLSGLPLLMALSLQRTHITGKALAHLKALGTLTVLNLSDNDITDADLGRISRIPGLEVLALANTRVTGSGLAGLLDLKRLNVLNLAGCRVSDGDLEHLMPLPNLRIVHATGCGIGEKAIKDLNRKLPMLSVFP